MFVPRSLPSGVVRSLLIGLAYIVLGWIGFVPEQPHLIAFVCIVLTGMSGGAVPSLSAIRWAAPEPN